MNENLDPETVAEIEAALAAGMDATTNEAREYDDLTARHIEETIYEQNPDITSDEHYLLAGKMVSTTDGPLPYTLRMSPIDHNGDTTQLLQSGRNLDAARGSIVIVLVAHARATDATSGERTEARVTFLKTPLALHTILRTTDAPDEPEHTTEMPEAGSPMLMRFLAFTVLATDDDR